MQYQSFGVGEFADVAISSEFTYLIMRAGDPRRPGSIQVWMWPNNTQGQAALIASHEVDAGVPAFPKIYYDTAYNELWYAWQVESTVWLRRGTADPQPFAPCENSSPFCFGNSAFAWQGAGAEHWPVSVMSLFSREVTSNVRVSQGTGLARVSADGVVVLVDEDRFSIPGVTNPCYAMGVSVAEHPDGGVVWLSGAARGLLWPGRNTLTPRVATFGTRTVICTMGGPEGVRVWTGGREELPVQENPVIVAVNRKLRLGWMELATPSEIPPGNCTLRLITDDVVRTHDGTALAAYIEAEKESNRPEVYQQKFNESLVRNPRLPVIAYCPHKVTYAVTCHLRGVEAYWLVGETLLECERRIRMEVGKYSRVALICQCYTSNIGQMTDLAALVPMYARILRDCGNIEFALIFSDAGRATGLNDHPELRALWQQLADTVGVPPIRLLPAPIDPPKEPVDPPVDNGKPGKDKDLDMPRIQDDKFEAWLESGMNFARRLYPNISEVEIKQSLREAGDRKRRHDANPSLWELVTAPTFRLRTAPSREWKAEELDVFEQEVWDEQERLRR